MKYPLTQKRFSHRRQLVSARTSTARSKARQSTLTQLDFVSTPPAQKEESEDSYSDKESESDRPAKRRKVVKQGRGTKREDKTLTQIGFVASTAIDDDDESTEDEVIRDSQHASEIAASPIKYAATDVRAGPTITSSPLPVARIRAVQVLSTPVSARVAEAPSSQTPASIALSSLHKMRSAQSRSSSPLLEKSTNLQPAVRRKLERVATIQDSDVEDDDLVAVWHGQDEIAPAGTVFPTQAQFTYDPADAALDRDAARAAWTQALLRKTTVEDTFSDHDEDLVLAARTSSPPVVHKEDSIVFAARVSSPLLQDKEDSDEEQDLGTTLRPSQISTVAPTQGSPPPLVFTSASTERQQKRGVIFVESSPLPVPPWTESEAAVWENLEKNDCNLEPHTMSDFSLPPPPGLLWSSPMYSLRKTSN